MSTGFLAGPLSFARVSLSLLCAALLLGARGAPAVDGVARGKDPGADRADGAHRVEDGRDVRGLVPRRPLDKSAAIPFGPLHRTDVIAVKFVDDLPVRALGGTLDDGGSSVLDPVRRSLPWLDGALWLPQVDLPPERIQALRARAEQNLGRHIADPRTDFFVFLPPRLHVQAALDDLNGFDVIELASPVSLPAPSPSAPLLAIPQAPRGDLGEGQSGPVLPFELPDFQFLQGHLRPAPNGIDAEYAWWELDVTGQGVRIADIEYQFNMDHMDLPDVEVLTFGTPGNPFLNQEHGTAVLGVLGARDNAWGTTGIAHGAELFFSHSMVNGLLNYAGAIHRCIDAFGPGDLILIEAQTYGPLSQWPAACVGSAPSACYGCVPVEWILAAYTAIQIAVGNGISVVQVGANGCQDLDHFLYSTGNGGHWPFLPENDSGAILVGAGHAPALYGGSGTARSRMSYSNWGSRLNLQGWGERIATTGYGDLFASLGPHLTFTGGFNGTSGAGPIVAGAAALVQSYHLAREGQPLGPLELRQLLVDTGTEQNSGLHPASQNIGPLPNVSAACDRITAGEPWLDLGGALAGSFGVPVLSASGELAGGKQVRFALDSALPLAPAVLALGSSAWWLPFAGGVLVPAPEVQLFFPLISALGSLSPTFDVPGGLGSGSTLYAQYWILDPGAVQGLAASNGAMAAVR